MAEDNVNDGRDGGGGSDGGGDDDGLGLDDVKGVVDDAVPDWLPDAEWVTDVPGGIIDALKDAGKWVERFLKNPRGFAGYWIFKGVDKVITPLYKGLYRLVILVVTLIGFVFYGSDFQLGTGGDTPGWVADVPWINGLASGNYLGIADIPVYLVSMFLGIWEDEIAPVLLYPINEFNAAVAAVAADAGLAALPVLFGLQVAEIGVGLYALSLVAETIVGYVVPGLSAYVGKVLRAPLKVISND